MSAMLHAGAIAVQPAAGHKPRSRLRLHGDGFSFFSSGLLSRSQRVACTIVLALDEGEVRVQTRDLDVSGNGFLVGPLCDRVLRSQEAPVFLIDIEPIHVRYPTFSAATKGEPVRALPADWLAGLRPLGQAFAQGQEAADYDRAMRREVHRLANHFGPQTGLDARVIAVMRAIEAQPTLHLTDLARRVHLSSGHLCRLFSESLGISLRQYVVSIKTRNAARMLGEGRALTDVALMAGFSDSSHFAKVWARCYGRPPQAFFRAHDLQLDPDALPDWARVPPQPLP